MTVKLLTKHHLEFLGLKVGCTGLSESIHVKMPHCWKSHVAAQLFLQKKENFPLLSGGVVRQIDQSTKKKRTMMKTCQMGTFNKIVQTQSKHPRKCFEVHGQDKLLYR